LDPTSRTRKPVFKCIPAETINGRIYAIDPTPDNGGVFWKDRARQTGGAIQFDIIKVKDRKTYWPMAFLNTGK